MKKIIKLIIFSIPVIISAVAIFNLFKPLPENIPFEGGFQNASGIKFLKDLTWTGENGLEKKHEIFDEIIKKIDEAEDFILMDMFLFNSFMGTPLQGDSSICGKLIKSLLQKKKINPDIFICIITDPINTVYNGFLNQDFKRLEENGIHVVFTNLDRLRDSNPLYSAFYRVFLKVWGNSPAQTVKNPFGGSKVSLRSYFRLLNFKANHRKTFICRTKDDIYAIVSSFNPHDASSYHLNAGVLFSGKAVLDLLESEKAVLEMSGFKNFPVKDFHTQQSESEEQIKIVTEKKIEENVTDLINSTKKGDKIDLVIFYLSHTTIINALKSASERGAEIRVLLDANKDAFGRQKNGIPNRVTGRELKDSNILVKWGKTEGNQLHSKLMLVKKASGENFLVTGSANFTRRNLDNFNLETNVIVKAETDTVFFKDALEYSDKLFSSTKPQFSIDYNGLSDPLPYKKYLYLFMEKTGFSTF